MSERVIAAAVRNRIEDEESPDALLAFVTVEHVALAQPIRIVSDVMDYVAGGLTYTGLPFGYRLLTDDEGATATEFRMQNVDRAVGQALRTLTDRARMSLTLRTSADFDLSQDPRTEIATSTIYAFTRFELVDVSVDVAEISGRVMLRDYSQEVWPGIAATQSRCPGLYR